MTKKFFSTFLLLLFSVALLHAQESKPKEKLVQITGVVVTGDSLLPVPFTGIIIKNTSRGVVADYFGFFSIVARMNDTLEFGSIGFKRSHFIVPDTLTEQRYSLIQVLNPDTILLKEATIYPWPTKEQFKEAFLALKIPDDELARAMRYLSPEQINVLAENMPMSSSMNYKYYMQQQSGKFYNAGTVPVSNLMNPIAWAKFIQQIKNGEFKKK